MRCPSCGAELVPGHRYCGMCGFRLAAALSGSDGGPGTRTLPSDAIAAAPGTAERRVVTVVFLDLVDYTPLAEHLDPEETRDLQARFFEVVAGRIAAFGGTVEKYIGDAVMAVWGAPIAHEDDAERAVRAALDVLGTLPRLRDLLGLPSLALRVGVASGEVAFNVGAVDHGLIAGDVVNMAARLEAAAEPGQVLVNAEARASTEEAIAYEPVGELTLKGRTGTVTAWRAERVVALVGGGGRSSRPEPPLVGRSVEFDRLRSAFLAEPGERPALVAIVGRPGIGKSRLVWELQKFTDGLVGNVYWHVGRCPAYGEDGAFRPLADVFRRRLGIGDGDAPDVALTRMWESLAWFVPDPDERRWIQPALAALLGLSREGPVDRDERFGAWRTFLERIADRAPTILVLDDLQWAQPELLEFVEHLAAWATPPRLLLVVVSRPELLERRPDVVDGPDRLLIRLEPLPPDAIRELVLTSAPSLPAEAVSQILERSTGVPLYAVETLRVLADRNRRAADRPTGADEPADPSGTTSTLTDDALGIPPTLQSLIAARLDVLEPAQRALVLDAAVLGSTFSVEALAAVSGRTRDAVASELVALAAREIVTPELTASGVETGRQRFVDGLVREVAYSTLARRGRRARHLRAADYLEAGAPNPDPAAVAVHVLSAHRLSTGAERELLADRTVSALVRAAERGLSIGAPEQALGWLRAAIAVGPAPEARAGLEEAAGAAAIVAALHAEAARHLRSAIEAYRERGERASVVRATARLASALVIDYRPAEAIAEIEHVLAEIGQASAADVSPGTAADLPDDPDVVSLVAELARAHHLHGRDTTAAELAGRAIDRAARLDLIPVLVEARTTLGSALAAIGRRTEGAGILGEAIAEAESHGLVGTSIRARHDLVVALMPDDPAAALVVAQSGLDLARRVGIRWAVVRLTGAGAEAALEVGAWDWLVDAAAAVHAFALTPPDRADIDGAAAVVAGWRDPAAGRVAIAALHRALDADPAAGPLAAGVVHYRSALLALGDGRPADALKASERAAASLREAGWSLAVRESWWPGARAAAWLGDRDAFARAAAQIRAAPDQGRWMDAVHASLDALEAGLGGPGDTAALMAAALRSWRELGLGLGLALAFLDAAVVSGLPTEDAAVRQLHQLGADGAADRILRRGEGIPA